MRAPYARTLFDLACEQAERYGDEPAIVAAGSVLAYADLAGRARLVAAALIADGVRRGDRVGVLASNRREWVEIVIGAAGAGAVAVPFSTWSTRSELDFLIADAGVSHLFATARSGDRDYAADLAALLAEAAAAARYPTFRRVVLIDPAAGDRFGGYDAFLAAASEAPDLPPGRAASAVDDGLVLYTSGSSATPKAVRLQQFGIVENGFNIGERQGLHPGDRVLIAPPLFWSYGSANALSATLTHGAAAVLQERFEAGEAIDLIERHGCTALYTLPGMTSAMLRHPGFSKERVRTLRTGLTIGSPQDVRAAAEALGAAEICNVYGATETFGNCCVTWHHWPLERRMNCQGEPLPGNELRFVDLETGLPVAAGEPGLAEVRGYISAGYSGASAELNDKAFTPDGFYRLGDVGRLDAEGAFVFVGRDSEMIKRAGINISPAEVENVLLLHPDVASAGVTGLPDRERGEQVIAFVVARPNAEPNEADLLAHCRSIASKYKVPDRIVVCPALPMTGTGKLQRRDLKKAAAELVGRQETRHG